MPRFKDTTDSSNPSYNETTNTSDTVTLTSCDPNTLTVYLANSETSYTLSTGGELDLVLQTSSSTLTLTFQTAPDFNGSGAAVTVGKTKYTLPHTFSMVETNTSFTIFYTVETGLPWDPLIKVVPPIRTTPLPSKLAGRSAS